jgi:hypothetical protein
VNWRPKGRLGALVRLFAHPVGALEAEGPGGGARSPVRPPGG